jgi:hypothetical protein
MKKWDNVFTVNPVSLTGVCVMVVWTYPPTTDITAFVLISRLSIGNKKSSSYSDSGK